MLIPDWVLPVTPRPKLAAKKNPGSLEFMSMTVDQLISEARQLPQNLRAELLDRLGEILHGDTSPEIAAEWNQLALDRLAAVESGQSLPLPGAEVMARMRHLINR